MNWYMLWQIFYFYVKKILPKFLLIKLDYLNRYIDRLINRTLSVTSVIPKKKDLFRKNFEINTIHLYYFSSCKNTSHFYRFFFFFLTTPEFE